MLLRTLPNPLLVLGSEGTLDIVLALYGVAVDTWLECIIRKKGGEQYEIPTYKCTCA